MYLNLFKIKVLEERLELILRNVKQFILNNYDSDLLLLNKMVIIIFKQQYTKYFKNKILS